MKIVLLAGGKGSRLWPASTDEIPKQFLKVYDNYTMIERVFKDLSSLYDSKDIYVATTNNYLIYLKELIPNFNNYIIEPKSKGTYSAILNIGAYLKYRENISDDEEICILPIDSKVDRDFFNILKRVEEKYKYSSSICLVGIKPNKVSSQYGYIIHDNDKVLGFKEKPDLNEAALLINKGALWNSGIVIGHLYKLMSLVNIYDVNNYEEFIYKYLDIPVGSFDVEVLEKERDLIVVKSNYQWYDIGIWENLSPLISKEDQYNTNIINYEDKRIINEGVKDSIIINSSNGIKLVNKKKNNICIKRWGNYEVLNTFEGTDNQIKIKKLTLFPNKNISYQYHNHRNEDLIILDGNGEIIIDGKIKKFNRGDKITVKIGAKHSIRANTLLEIVEVQYGYLCEEEDIVRLENDWNKIINIHDLEV